MSEKENFETQKSGFRLPRWEELPDIELYMDQVITLMGKYFGGLSLSDEPFLTSSMINNYVKNEIIPAPVKKKYSRTHLFRLIIICMMKQVLPINDIGMMIDSLLKTKSEAEVLNLFAQQYESEYLNTTKMLDENTEKRSAESEEAALSLSVMHAAAIAGVSKLYAENALARLCKLSAPPEKPAEETKEAKESKESAKEKKERKKAAKSSEK